MAKTKKEKKEKNGKMIPPYFFTETTETEIFQINWNNWSKLIGTQPQGNPLFSRRQAQSICFSP